LAEHINRYLANPRLHAENRRRLLDQELGVPVGEASPRIVETLLQIGGRRHVRAPGATERVSRASRVEAVAAQGA
jgi:hypothetical protein